MKTDALSNLDFVRQYHERTKHHPDRYAASPGHLDWETQPDPFRTYVGAEMIDLPHPALNAIPTYDALFAASPDPRVLNADMIGRLFYHSLALSAWKQVAGGGAWSLRINPSSGALHPTEGYLISGRVNGLIDAPGVFHYAPYQHQLERRCRLSVRQWEDLTTGLPESCLLLGLTSIYWREAWKYGERAFRYCHHDVGHALGAVACAARTFGWEARPLDVVPDHLDRLLGVHDQSGFAAEHGDILLTLFPSGESVDNWRASVHHAEYVGEPSALGDGHRDWPVIADVADASRCEPIPEVVIVTGPVPVSQPDRGHPAETILRQRRSAVDMDGETFLTRDAFYGILGRTLPACFPFAALDGAPRVSLAVFVHRVEGLDSGLYLLVRDPSHGKALRDALNDEFDWSRPDGCPDDLALFLLGSGDLRDMARAVSCNQDIAADGCFAVAMLADFDAALAARGPAAYPRLFWETGLIGQVLYLEAEAAGVRGTGIGCFFDDVVHDILGLDDTAWQSLYHFTVGGPVVDARIRMHPPYAHLDRYRQSD